MVLVDLSLGKPAAGTQAGGLAIPAETFIFTFMVGTVKEVWGHQPMGQSSLLEDLLLPGPFYLFPVYSDNNQQTQDPAKFRVFVIYCDPGDNAD